MVDASTKSERDVNQLEYDVDKLLDSTKDDKLREATATLEIIVRDIEDVEKLIKSA